MHIRPGTTRPRRGFTLIELLVVIAIIGILAAMVFPVFARARESARKAVCLSNVKNIGLAIQMYLADNNDTLPPKEHRAEVLDYFSGIPGGGDEDPDWCTSHTVNLANPYLRWPTILDEYIKNRDVWRCPSAKLIQGASFIVGDPDWLQWYQVNEGAWGENSGKDRFGPCFTAWPKGWGGEVTDSILQDKLAVNQKADNAALRSFVQTIGTKEVYDWGRKLVSVQDTTNYVIIGDCGANTYDNNVGTFAYPDICQIGCSNPCCSSADWDICASEAADCGLYIYAPNNGAFLKDPGLAKQYSRHLGGINLGFLDGHAQWASSQSFINNIAEGTWSGIDIMQGGPNSVCADGCFPQTYPDIPILF